MIEVDLKRLDSKIAIGSGVLTGALDILLVPELSFADANTWGSDRIQAFALTAAKNRGYDGDDLSGAMKYLKDEKSDVREVFAEAFSFESEKDIDEEETVDEDDETDEEEAADVEDSVEMLADQRDIDGLIFSIVTYVSGKSIGIDNEGKIVCRELDGFQRKSFEEGIYWGTLRWLFNFVYAGLEDGLDRINNCIDPEIPNEIRSILNQLTEFPGFENKAKKLLELDKELHDKDYYFQRLSERIYSAIEQEKDGKPGFGMILGVAHEMVDKKQYVPVVLNELIVSAFFTASRFMMELSKVDINDLESLEDINFRACLPIQNEELRSMRKLASTTFMSVNLVKSGIKAAFKCNNPKEFGVHFLQNINYFGAVDCIACVTPDCGTAFDLFYGEFKAMADEQKEFFKDVLHKVNEAVGVAGKVRETAKTIANMASPVNYVRAVKEVYIALNDTYADLQLARERRIAIEAECAEHIRELQQYETELQQVISDYFVKKYTTFGLAFDTIDKAMAEDDIDMFISGQNLIQRELSGKVLFENMDEFDDLMDSDDPIVF